jgi:hypothetical protein
MANVVAPVSFTFRDSQGRTSLMKVFRLTTLAAGQDDLIAGAAADTTAIAALSNAHVTNSVAAPASITYGANAEFPSAQDKATFVFVTATGARHVYQVGAPKLAIFKADGITVDVANTAVLAFVAIALAGFTDRSGNLMTTFVGGLRLRKKLPRRTNLFVLAPDDAGPEE